MLLVSSSTDCWVLDIATLTGGRPALRGLQVRALICSQTPPLPSGFELRFDDRHVALLRDSVPVAELRCPCRDDVAPLFVDGKVFLLGDTLNEVVDLASGSSRELPGQDVGEQPFVVQCGRLVVAITKSGQISVFDPDIRRWTDLTVPMDPGTEVQGVTSGGGLLYVKLPLSLAVLRLDRSTWWKVDAPWLMNPRLQFLDEPVAFVPTVLEPVRMAPVHEYDPDAKRDFMETGETNNPAAVVSCCVREGDLGVLAAVLTRFDVDDCLFSRERTGNDAPAWCPLHRIVSSESEALKRLVQPWIEKRVAPRLYASPAHFCFDIWLGGLKHVHAKKWIELLGLVFVNAQELI